MVGPIAMLFINFLIQVAIAVAASAIINLLFPTKIFGPKLNDLRVQTSTYGVAIPLLLGQAVRVAGNVIWSAGLVETAETDGGGLFGGPEVTTYTYKTSVAVAFGERPNGIAGVVKIFANGKMIYDATALLDAESDGDVQGDFPIWNGSLLNATWAFLFAISGRAGPAVPFLQRLLGTQAVFKTITVYPGDFTQTPDPLMVAALGVGNVPAYRGTAYLVIEDLQLADFGNMLPNLEFLVIANPDETYRTAIETIVSRAGISEDQYNFDCLLDPLGGYVIAREITATEALAPLTFAGNLDIVDDAGNLRGIKRDEEVIAIISTEDLGGHQFGDDRPDPIAWTREATLSLPGEFAVTFVDPARDLQPNSVAARRSAGTADSSIGVELALTLSATQARALADRGLWESWLAMQSARIQTTDRLIDMHVGRVYLFATPAGVEALRVFAKTRGQNGVTEWELRRERSELYTSPNPGTNAALGQSIGIPGPTELILLDMPILRDADDESGFYFAVVGSETNWRGAPVMRAISDGEDFVTFQAAGAQSVVGDVTGTLADGQTELDLGPGTFDDVNYIDVELRHGGMTLESISDDAIDAGGNMAFVGNPDDTTEGEVIQFGVATLQSGNIWRLTHLRRGKRGTEFATTLHGSGEIFVLLKQSSGATMRKDFGVPDLDLERLYKAVSLLFNADDVEHTFFTNTGVGLRPYSPVDLSIDADTVGDLVLNWTRRSRLDSGVLGEAAEVYEVRILDVDTVVRVANPTEPTFTYTEAMQIADFGDVVTHLCWRVAQVSAVYGNGIFAESCGAVIESSGALSSGMMSSGMSSGDAVTVVVLTAGTTWAIPADWTDVNTVECIGGGGGGGGTSGGTYRGGGGGGAYSKVSNITGLSGSVDIQIGAGGAGATNGLGAAGTDTWFNGASLAASSVGAKAGAGGGSGGPNGVGGAGGDAAAGIGTTKTSGGQGGPPASSTNGGGGGAGGANGDGGGGAASGALGPQVGAGGGGGNGGAAGTNTVGGGAGGAGAAGGGGGGNGGTNVPGAGAAGANGTNLDASAGSGGGGGSGGDSGGASGAGGDGGLYGGGGGASGVMDIAHAGGDGAQGVIVITYVPAF